MRKLDLQKARVELRLDLHPQLPATLGDPDQIQQVLVPDVIRDDWKKWWEAAKRELKKDGHFQVPLKKTEAIVYQVKEISLQNRLLDEFRTAKGLKARLLVAGEL